MPIRYEYNPVTRRVHSHADGTLTAVDFGSYCEAVLADCEIESGFVETLVIDPGAHILVTFRDLLPFAELWRRYLRKGCIGTLVLAQSPAGYGIVRMFEGAIDSHSLSSDVEFALVESAEEMEARVEGLQALHSVPAVLLGQGSQLD